MLKELAYQSARIRPKGPATMFQRWQNLLFAHFPVPLEVIDTKIPKGLTVDTFADSQGNEVAWIGIVTFEMSGIRMPGGPIIPYLSAFPETNVRTYVHHDGSEPGVFFFSLDASRWLACVAARRMYTLNYYHAEISTETTENWVDYRLRRLEEPLAELHASYEIGERLAQPKFGSFEHWAVERYVLYSEHQGGLMKAHVWHDPYKIQEAHSVQLETNLCEAIGLPFHKPTHHLYSKGVEVEVFALQSI